MILFKLQFHIQLNHEKMYKDNKTLRSLRSRCIEEHHIQDEAKQKKVKHELESLAIKASVSPTDLEKYPPNYCLQQFNTDCLVLIV